MVMPAIRQYRKGVCVGLLGGECAGCGSMDKLQFDHINGDRVDDKHQISMMIDWASWPEIKEELKKCQLLCVACHWEKTYKEQGYGAAAHGTSTCYRKGCRCDECRAFQSDYLKQYRVKKQATKVE